MAYCEPLVRESSVEIASGGTESPAIQTWIRPDAGNYAAGFRRGSFQIPAAFTGTGMTIQASNDGVNWVECDDTDGTDPTPTITANGSYRFPNDGFAYKYLRLVAGSAQLHTRTITIFMAT